MYGTGVEGMRGMGGSVPWLVDRRATKLNAAQNKYLQSNSSIFGDNTGHLDTIKNERKRQVLDDLHQQIADRETAKMWEKAEEDRLYAAMALPTEPIQGRMPVQVQDTAAEVKETGVVYGGGDGGYGGYGGYGGGGFDSGGYGGGYGGGGHGAGGYVPSGYNSYSGARRPPRPHVSMTFDDTQAMKAAQADQLRNDLQWQVQMKKQLEEERKQREALEEKLLEENARRQQERMQQEFEAEQEKSRRKGKEQGRRREAQLRQMEAAQQRLEAEKKEKMDRARRLADLTETTRPPPPREDFGRDARVIKPMGGGGDATKTGGRRSTTSERKSEHGDELDFNSLRSDPAFLAAQKPNKFFDNPSTALKIPRGHDDRKRPKPLTPVSEAPRKANNSLPLGVTRLRKAQPNRPRTTLAIGAMMDTNPPAPHPPGPGPMQLSVPPGRVNTKIQTLSMCTAEAQVQSEAAPNGWMEDLSPPQKTFAHPSAVGNGKNFDWKIRIEEPSEQERKKMEQMSQEEIKQFQEKNKDLLSQLTAIKTDLKSARGDRQPRQDGRGGQGAGGGGQNIAGGAGDGGGYNVSNGYVTSNLGEMSRHGGVSAFPTVPSGSGEEVDYMRIPTAQPQINQQQTQNSQAPTQTREVPPHVKAAEFSPDDTSRTILKKFLEKKKGL